MGTYGTTLASLVLLGCCAAEAQAPGWSYSPLPGEGDRAAIGCARGSDKTQFSCLAVRCEDDFSVGVYLHTSRPTGDIGRWMITLDREHRWVRAVPTATPYGAKIADELAWLLDGIKLGAVAFLTPGTGGLPSGAPITLRGSERTINEALYFCAPKRPTL